VNSPPNNPLAPFALAVAVASLFVIPEGNLLLSLPFPVKNQRLVL